MDTGFWRRFFSMPKFYHYTTQEHGKEIEDCGFIRTGESNVTMDGTGGPDVIWLFPDRINETKDIPNMLYAPLYEEGELGPVPVGVAVPKVEMEYSITLEREEVTRADKFMKKHNADSVWVKTLEQSGGRKFKQQYVIERNILVEECDSVELRADLMKPMAIDKLRRRISSGYTK